MLSIKGVIVFEKSVGRNPQRAGRHAGGIGRGAKSFAADDKLVGKRAVQPVDCFGV